MNVYESKWARFAYLVGLNSMYTWTFVLLGRDVTFFFKIEIGMDFFYWQ